MAFDVANLALNANAQIDFEANHWRVLVNSATQPYFQALGWTATTFAELPAARSGARGEIVVHPLWSPTNSSVTAALGEAQTNGVTAQVKTLFEVLRRPF